MLLGPGGGGLATHATSGAPVHGSAPDGGAEGEGLIGAIIPGMGVGGRTVLY